MNNDHEGILMNKGGTGVWREHFDAETIKRLRKMVERHWFILHL